MSLLPFFFKSQSHRKFSYSPRYYDSVKDRQRIRFGKTENESGSSSNEDDIREAYKIQRESNTKLKNRSSVRILVIMSVLLPLVYFLLFT